MDIAATLGSGLASVALSVVASIASVKATQRGDSRRISRLEDAADRQPQLYVPRTEVEARLDSIKDTTSTTQRLLEAFIRSGGDHSIALHALEAGAAPMVDEISEQRLRLVHPVLAEKVRAAAVALAAHGIYFRVAVGLRSVEDENKLYQQGRSLPGPIVTNAHGGYSAHNFGYAVDCFPFLHDSHGPIDLNDPKLPIFVAMVTAMKAQGLAWGGDWHSIKDNPHFQLASYPTTPTQKTRNTYAEHGCGTAGLQAVWKLYDAKETA